MIMVCGMGDRDAPDTQNCGRSCGRGLGYAKQTGIEAPGHSLAALYALHRDDEYAISGDMECNMQATQYHGRSRVHVVSWVRHVYSAKKVK